ncbi:uncharacterized protein G2W53_030791 [Senna tora]|uniref:Uncharacterized protein n=1 Tax=Senna tora TaxID=362788 RepID=A0A834T7P7_9FABA|nr:uncharacterized protein G2W53_030791 [Senna tora]
MKLEKLITSSFEAAIVVEALGDALMSHVNGDVKCLTVLGGAVLDHLRCENRVVSPRNAGERPYSQKFPNRRSQPFRRNWRDWEKKRERERLCVC